MLSDCRRAPEDSHLSERWSMILQECGLTDAVLLSARRSGIRRVYSKEGRLYKIQRKDLGVVGRFSPSSLRHEYEMMRRCYDIKWVPRVICYFDTTDYSLLTVALVDGTPMIDRASGQCLLRFSQLPVAFFRLSVILAKLSLRGIAHNDIEPWNVLVSARSHVWLIDYDQAQATTIASALYRNFMKRRNASQRFWGSLSRLCGRVLKQLAIQLAGLYHY